MRQIMLTIFLTVVMNMVGVKAKAYGHDFKDGNIYYCFITDRPGEVKVVNEINASGNECKSYSGIINIPETVVYKDKSYRVTEIGNSAFYKCKDLTKVSIPESVKIIDIWAFRDCSGLTSITIPNSVTSIGNGAFSHCVGLKYITIPNSVTSISHSAFYWCMGLISVSIPNSVTSIGDGAFTDCRSLTSIEIPNSVTSIGDDAFEGCRSLTSFEIPNSVTSIGIKAFEGCTGLTSIEIPNSVTSIGNKAFYECSKLTTVTVYSNSIVSKEYSSENSLKDIFGTQVQTYIIGDEVQNIGKHAFYGCNALSSLTVSANNPKYDSRENCNAIIETATNTLVVGCKNSVIPNSVISIGDNAFSGCSGLTSITIPNSLISIGTGVFADCFGLTSVTINNNAIVSKDYSSENSLKDIFGTQVQEYIVGNEVQSIGQYAFYGSSGLTFITIPNSVASIGQSAFESCSSLTSVTINSNSIVSKDYSSSSSLKDVFGTQVKEYIIGNEVQSIGQYAFERCTGLNSVTIPNSVASIGQYAFSKCTGLNSVTIPNSVASIGDNAFSGCSGLTSVTVEDGNSTYDSRNNCNAIIETATNTLIVGCKNSVIPNSVTSIGDNAFRGCSSLTSITIPNSVTSIGDNAFNSCSDLTSITIPNSVTSIGNYAFEFCSDLTSITIPNSVTSIGNYAFEFCYNLASITIPNSVTSIGDYAFRGCYSLTSITIPNSVTSINSYAFSGCSGMTSITIPNSVTSIGDGAFEFCKGLTSITIPNSVTSIGSSAFSRCTGLNSVTIPNSVTNIGNYAFHYCTGLTSITIPNSLTSIGRGVFADCFGLTSVTINNNAIVSKDYSSENSLKDIFGTQVQTYIIGDEVQNIGKHAFYGCNALSSLTVSANNPKYDSRENCNAIIETATKTLVIGCKNSVIPNSVTSIGDNAFSGCSGLTSITIPNNVTSIGVCAFEGCSSLTTVEIKAKTPPYAAEKAFPTDDHAVTLYVPRGSKAAYETANVWKDFSSIVETGVMVTADDLTMVYGDAVPELTYKAEGGSFTGTPQITCEATSISPVGTYPIVISKGTIDSDEVTYVNGKLTITKAPLKITAKSYSIKQGDALPTFEATYEGFKNNETNSVLTTQPTISTTATSASEPGIYEIVVSGAEATNYDISYEKGTLTITQANPVTVTAKSYSRKYGEANPTFEYTSEGATLTGTPEITCEATATSPVGEYDIVVSKGSITNYNVTLENGKLTVMKAPLTITAKSYTIKQGDALPTFEADYSGFKNNETDAVLAKKPTITTSATSSSAPGTYDIVVSGADATNYDITYVKGTLTITPADAIIVTAKSYSREYGEANPSLEYTVSGGTLTGTPSISCSATATSSVGEYDIVVSKGSVSNYNVTLVNGKLTVTKAPLTITAMSYTIKQGDDLPTFEASYEGFKNNETSSVLTSQPTITTTATSASEPGTYDIIVYGASATNYDITYVKGTLTISAKEVEPVTGTETTTFSEEVNENTDLSNTIIDNTYYTMNAENGDGYDATEQAIVLNSTTTAEQMNTVQNAQVGDATMQANYNGIIFEIPTGSGTITVEVKTIGSHILNVQIGNGAPNKITKSERGTADVPYNVTAPTYVYLYASTSGASGAPQRAAAANSVLLYSYKVDVLVNGISVVTYGDMENAKWYTMDGLQLQGKPTKKGLYIVNGRKVVVK